MPDYSSAFAERKKLTLNATIKNPVIDVELGDLENDSNWAVLSDSESPALTAKELLPVLQSADNQINDIKSVLDKIDSEVELLDDKATGEQRHKIKNRRNKVSMALMFAQHTRRDILSAIGEKVAVKNERTVEEMRIASELRMTEARQQQQIKREQAAENFAFQKELQLLELKMFGKCLVSISDGIEGGYLTLDAIQTMIKRCFERKNLELDEVRGLNESNK
jgi:hypothetical protein